MRITSICNGLVAAAALTTLCGAHAEAPQADLVPIPANGVVTTPATSEPVNVGLAFFSLSPSIEVREANTNINILKPMQAIEPMAPGSGARQSVVETPASIACIYGLVERKDGCNPDMVVATATGGSHVIVIVDAYDDPNIESDLKVFSQRFNLPPAKFRKVFASGTAPERNEGWEIEIALDVEWAHAMAPDAEIVLVESSSNRLEDLLAAVKVANGIVRDAGGGEISMSWGGYEFSAQSSENHDYFSEPGAVYFAASGDTPGVSHPSTLANVVSVGGTTIVRDDKGMFLGEIPWKQGGAGDSAFERKPPFQMALGQLRAHRGAVDVAAVADVSVGGVWVYDSGNADFASNNGWMPIGGTSAAAPIVAAIVNNAGRFKSSSADELQLIYSGIGSAAFNHVQKGSCGSDGEYATGDAGWTYCTGVGTPAGRQGL